MKFKSFDEYLVEREGQAMNAAKYLKVAPDYIQFRNYLESHYDLHKVGEGTFSAAYKDGPDIPQYIVKTHKNSVTAQLDSGFKDYAAVAHANHDRNPHFLRILGARYLPTREGLTETRLITISEYIYVNAFVQSQEAVDGYIYSSIKFGWYDFDAKKILDAHRSRKNKDDSAYTISKKLENEIVERLENVKEFLVNEAYVNLREYSEFVKMSDPNQSRAWDIHYGNYGLRPKESGRHTIVFTDPWV